MPLEGVEVDEIINRVLEDQKKYGIGLISVLLNDKWIGFCCVFKYKDQWDFGYRFYKGFWGNGYATEAVIALRKYLQENMLVENVFSFIQPENIASIRVAEKSGMKYIGKDVFRGLDVVKYEVL